MTYIVATNRRSYVLLSICIFLAMLSLATGFVGLLTESSTTTLGTHLVTADVFEEIQSLARGPGNPVIDVARWATESETLFLSEGPVVHSVKSIVKSATTAVFSVLDTEYALVYREYCHSVVRPYNPQLVEAWFLRYLQGLGLDIAPKFYAISAPLDVDAVIEARDNGGVDEDDWVHVESRDNENSKGKLEVKLCTRTDATPEIRYILMERVEGASIFAVELGNSVDARVPLYQVAQYGIDMIMILQELHEKNVIHGDANFENFIVDPFFKTMRKIVDFEDARIYNHREMNSIDTPCQLGSNSPNINRSFWNSPWNSCGCIKSFRDDIYRVFLSLATMMYGRGYAAYFSELAVIDKETAKEVREDRKRDMWRQHRFTGDIFEITDQTRILQSRYPDKFRDLMAPLNLGQITFQHKVAPVAESFKKLSEHVMSLGFTDRPNYDLILRQLVSIRTHTELVMNHVLRG